MARHVQRDVDPQIWLTLSQPRQQANTQNKSQKKTHRIPLHTPIHPHGKIPVSTDIDIQTIGLITPASFIGRDFGLAIILRVPRRAGVDDLDDDGPVDLVVGGRAVWTDVVDAVAGAAFYDRWRAGRRCVVGGWILAAVCCAGRGNFVRWVLKGRFDIGRAGRGDASDEMRDGPNAGIVLKVHVWLATGAQPHREVFANVTSRSSEDTCIICVDWVSDRCSEHIKILGLIAILTDSSPAKIDLFVWEHTVLP